MIWVVSDSPVQSALCSSCKGMVDLVHNYQTQEKGSAGKACYPYVVSSMGVLVVFSIFHAS